MRIGLDLDGVCYDWDRTVRYLLRERLPDSPYKDRAHPVNQPSTHWDYLEGHLAPEHWRWIWKDGVAQGLFRHGHIIKGAVEGMRDLLADGHDLVVVTSRPKQAINDTLQWIAFLGIPFSGVHIISDGSPKSQVKCDVYVDDRDKNVEDLARNTNAKLVALYSQTWNASYTAAPPVVRVANWGEFVQCVRGLK